MLISFYDALYNRVCHKYEYGRILWKALRVYEIHFIERNRDIKINNKSTFPVFLFYFWKIPDLLKVRYYLLYKNIFGRYIRGCFSRGKKNSKFRNLLESILLEEEQVIGI